MYLQTFDVPPGVPICLLGFVYSVLGGKDALKNHVKIILPLFDWLFYQEPNSSGSKGHIYFVRLRIGKWFRYRFRLLYDKVALQLEEVDDSWGSDDICIWSYILRTFSPPSWEFDILSTNFVKKKEFDAETPTWEWFNHKARK